MKIGIFGGAFNPFHNGHLQLMTAYLNELSLDKILLIPTAVPPHKTAEHLISGEDRLNMLNLVCRENECFEVSDMEFHRKGKSYSYDTICELKKIHPDAQFYLIVGSDQFFCFQNWYRAEDILNLVTLCTSARNSGEYQKMCEFQSRYDNMKNCIVSDFDVFEISSSKIREKRKRGESIKGLVPKEVENYIKEHMLYV